MTKGKKALMSLIIIMMVMLSFSGCSSSNTPTENEMINIISRGYIYEKDSTKFKIDKFKINNSFINNSGFYCVSFNFNVVEVASGRTIGEKNDIKYTFIKEGRKWNGVAGW
jgi:hypothetical protein